jgi:uncharacterized protein YbjT (DUF2867 family)
MTNKILITGASGNIGQPLVEALKKLGADFAIMRSKPGASADGVETRVASFDDVASLTRAFTGIDTLFLLFPLVENKITLAKNAATAAKAAGVKHIVRSSGAGADPASSFSLSKLQGEIDQLLAATGIPTTFLRPGAFMQNYLTYQTQAIKSGMVCMADGGKPQALIDTRDIAGVAATILINPAAHAGKAYHLTGGEEITGARAAAMISAVIGRTVTHTSIPTEQAVETMKQWGMPPFIIDVMDSLNRVISLGYASGVSPEVTQLLGRPPRTFADFARENAAVWK